jgi:hypothetical protein
MDSAFSTAIPDPSLAAIGQLSENSRLGVRSKNTNLYRGIEWSKSTLALGLPEWSGKTASDHVVGGNSGPNCTPLTKGCFNVPTLQQLVTSQCLAGYNSSTAAKGIQFFSLYNLATNFWSALPDWTVLPAAKIGFVQTANWASQQIGTGEFINVTSYPASVVEIPSATSAVVDLTEAAAEASAAPAIVAGTGLDILANAGCAMAGRQAAGQMSPLPPGWASSF